MCKPPAARQQSAAELAEELRQYEQCLSQSSGHPTRQRLLRLLLTGAGILALLFAGLAVYFKTGEGTLVLSVDEPDVKVTIDGQEVQVQSPRRKITLAVGRHSMEVSKEGSGRLRPPVRSV